MFRKRVNRILDKWPDLALRLEKAIDRVASAQTHPFRRGVLLSLVDRVQPVFLDYPVAPRSRYGHGLPPHPELLSIIESGRSRYDLRLRTCLSFLNELRAIPHGPESAGPDDPCWINDYFGGLDGAILYGLIAERNPATFLEVGSGTSTKFVRRAIRDHSLRTRIVSIDPKPRADVDAVCDRVVRKRFEDADLSILDELRPGDMFFLDGSHRVFMNSDVTVAFLDVLPRLPADTLVQLHDIFLPDDYLPFWDKRYYSEQYMLAAFILGGGGGMEIHLPNWFITNDPELGKVLAPLWDHHEMNWTGDTGQPLWSGCSFWLRTN